MAHVRVRRRCHARTVALRPAQWCLGHRRHLWERKGWLANGCSVSFGGTLHLSTVALQKLWSTLACINFASPVAVLRSIGCDETAPWTWVCGNGQVLRLRPGAAERPQRLEAQKHELREQFRRHSFERWLASSRHEAASTCLLRTQMDADFALRHVALGATVPRYTRT